VCTARECEGPVSFRHVLCVLRVGRFLPSSLPPALARVMNTMNTMKLLRDVARRAGRGSGAAAQHLAPPPLGGVCFADLDLSRVAFASSSSERSLAGLLATPRGDLRTGGGRVERQLGLWCGYAAAGYSGRRGGGGPSRRRDDYEEVGFSGFDQRAVGKVRKVRRPSSFWWMNTATTSTLSTSQSR
jgi:hypothetical protein